MPVIEFERENVIGSLREDLHVSHVIEMRMRMVDTVAWRANRRS